MSDDDKSRRRTLVGLEPPSEEIRTAFRASVSEPSILHVSPRNLDARAPLGRKSTNPYGVPAAPARRSAWSIEREPSLYGFFLADGASVGPAHRTRLRALGLPQRHFMERRSPKPSPLPQPNEALPQVGSVLDKFRLDELLGVGGFGAVYRATHLLLKRQVAIKLLRPSVLARKPELRTLLSREAELVARLDHPNVVRMIDVFVQESGAFLVMEFVEGRSLAAVLRRRRLTPLEVIDVGLDVARGLAAGLEKGLIHRDIKPANIMVTHRGTAKIVDFGLALCFSDATAASRSQVVGTRGYVAPEQVSEPHKVDFRADIFSLGASLYHAAIGVPPFPIDDSGSGLSMSTHPPAMVPQHLAQTFPTALSRLLMWMLANNRADRPASYELLEQAFERARTEVASAKELPVSDKSDLDDEWENLLDDLEVVDKAKQAPPRPPRPESKTEPRVPPPPPSSRGGEPRNPDDDTTYRFVADRKPALRPPPRPLPVPAQRASAPSAAKPPRPASEAAERPRSDQTGAEKAPPPAAERPPVDKAAADKAAMEKAAADKAAADKAAADKAAADKAAADKAAADKDAADKVAAAHKAAADKAAMEKAAAEKAAAARRAAAEKAALERSAAEKAALDRAAAEKAERERLAAEAAAQQHAELQRRRGLVGPEAGDADWLAALEDEPLQTAGEAREPELAPSEPVSAPVAPYSDSHRKDPVCAVWLSGTCFGLPVSIVGEYAPITSFTDVPLAPDHVLGVFNLRGMALPVVDLAGALGFEGTKTLKRALVLGDGSIQFAVPADRVEMIAAQRQRGRRPRGAMDHPAVEGFLELDDQRVITLLSGQAVVQAVARLGEG